MVSWKSPVLDPVFDNEALNKLDRDTEKQILGLMPRFRRFALGLARNQGDADDLLQAALEKVVVKIDQWEKGTRLDSWIFRVIQTTHIDQIRQGKRQARLLEEAGNRETGYIDGERAQEARITLDAVRRAIFNLPDEQRATVMLVMVEGLSYKEAAETLSIPIGTLTSRLVRARNALAGMLEWEQMEIGDYSGNNPDGKITKLENGG